MKEILPENRRRPRIIHAPDRLLYSTIRSISLLEKKDRARVVRSLFEYFKQEINQEQK